MKSPSEDQPYGAAAAGARRAAFIAAGLLVLASAVAFLLLRLYSDRTGERSYRIALEAEARGDTRAADLSYEAAERLGLHTPEFLTSYGRFELGLERYGRAESLFRRALEQNLGYGPAHFGLGDLYTQQGHWESAAQEFTFAGEAMPEEAAERFTDAGYIYMGLDNLPKARDLFRRALEADSTFDRALIGLAESMVETPEP